MSNKKIKSIEDYVNSTKKGSDDDDFLFIEPFTMLPNREDAPKLARKKFAAIYGCDYKKLETYVMYNETRQREDLEYYRQSGLPDEIPS